MREPLVSVLMPVFNGEKYLGEAINSILSQSYTNFEFLILDDGSTDKSVSIVKSYTDRRIKHIIAPQNCGIEKTLNKGLQLAQGEYIARMDCDDISYPRRLERQVSFMESNQDIGVLGAAMRIKKYPFQSTVRRWPATDDEIKVHLLFQNPLSHPVIMMRKTMVAGFLYPEDCKYAEDYRLWTILAHHAKFANLPDVLLQYRTHENQITEKQSERSRLAARKAREAYLLDLLKNISPQELTIHHQIAEKERTVNLDDAKLWIEKLAGINREKSLFPQETLLPVLAINWWRCCRNNRNSGLMLWKSYKSSFLSAVPTKEPHHFSKYLIKWMLNDLRKFFSNLSAKQ